MYSTYVVVVLAVVLSSTPLLFLLQKKNMLDFPMFLSIALSSVIMSLVFPLTCYALINEVGLMASSWGAVISAVIALIIHMTLILLLAIVISSFITEQKSKVIMDALKNKLHLIANFSAGFERSRQSSGTGAEKEENNWEKAVDSVDITDKMGLDTILPTGIKETADAGNTTPAAGITETGAVADPKEAIVEAVDPGTKTGDIPAVPDKLVPEELMPETESIGQELGENMSVEAYVEEAFRLKMSGDLEGAILYYMYALDLKPEKELVLWLVVDICSLYKTLGQIELAREILDIYASRYSDLIDEWIKLEIEKNLL